MAAGPYAKDKEAILDEIDRQLVDLKASASARSRGGVCVSVFASCRERPLICSASRFNATAPRRVAAMFKFSQSRLFGGKNLTRPC
jgi:hypothetical protein